MCIVLYLIELGICFIIDRIGYKKWTCLEGATANSESINTITPAGIATSTWLLELTRAKIEFW